MIALPQVAHRSVLDLPVDSRPETVQYVSLSSAMKHPHAVVSLVVVVVVLVVAAAAAVLVVLVVVAVVEVVAPAVCSRSL